MAADDEGASGAQATEGNAEGVVAGDEDEDDDEDDRSFGRQLRVDPVGAVNQGARIEQGDPYAAQGIRLGNLTIRPSIEIGLSGSRTTSNVDQGGTTGLTQQRSETVTNENAISLLVNSDWSRHALEAELNGTFPVAISGSADEPTYSALANLRLDVSSATTLTLGAEITARSEDPQSAAYQDATNQALNPGVTGANEPTTNLYAGTASLAHDFGGVFTQISASIGRLEYSAARLNNGTSVSQSDLNSTDYNFRLRGGYALSGVLSPFVEFNYGLRRTDDTLDSSGINRNSKRYGVQVGALVDMGEKLNGELAVGYGVEKLDDDRFAATKGLNVSAELNWSPLRGTDVNLDVSTQFQPSGIADVAGSLTYATEIGLQHRLTSRLTGNAAFGIQYEDFSGPRDDQTTLSGEIGLLYNFNRFMALTGRLRHEQQYSANPEQRESTSSAFVGLRFQR